MKLFYVIKGITCFLYKNIFPKIKACDMLLGGNETEQVKMNFFFFSEEENRGTKLKRRSLSLITPISHFSVFLS